ncbi:MAG: DUF6318 family protein [Nocardioides sp.]|uniref:DUF6318 family protein n=1 Tax=Nocardioides sp. TaxID=35761 RepID=UPI0039E3DF3F
MRRTTITSIVLLLGVATPLSGCGDDSPGSAPTPSTVITTVDDPTPTTSPTAGRPQPPRMPAAARRHTLAGAKAFTRYFVEVLNYMTATADATILASLASENCDTCESVRLHEKKIRRRNGVISGGLHTARNIIAYHAIDNDPSSPIIVQMKLHTTQEKISYPTGKLDVFPTVTSRMEMTIVQVRHGWKISTWALLD